MLGRAYGAGCSSGHCGEGLSSLLGALPRGGSSEFGVVAGCGRVDVQVDACVAFVGCLSSELVSGPLSSLALGVPASQLVEPRLRMTSRTAQLRPTIAARVVGLRWHPREGSGGPVGRASSYLPGHRSRVRRDMVVGCALARRAARVAYARRGRARVHFGVRLVGVNGATSAGRGVGGVVRDGLRGGDGKRPLVTGLLLLEERERQLLVPAPRRSPRVEKSLDVGDGQLLVRAHRVDEPLFDTADACGLLGEFARVRAETLRKGAQLQEQASVELVHMRRDASVGMGRDSVRADSRDMVQELGDYLQAELVDFALDGEVDHALHRRAKEARHHLRCGMSGRRRGRRHRELLLRLAVGGR